MSDSTVPAKVYGDPDESHLPWYQRKKCHDKIDWLIEKVFKPISFFIGFLIRMIGPAFCSALYYLLYLHVEAFFGVIVKVMKKRLGTPFGMIWISIGLTILYNIVWNHMLAMLVKAGGPTELAKVEKLRQHYKQRETRKKLKFAIEGGGGAV